jgi:lipopolysaccharide transport system permease protein
MMSSAAPAADIKAPPTVTLIKPSSGLFDLELGNVWRYRELLVTLITRDIQVLYKHAALGASWAIIQPLFSVLIFSVIFGYVLKMPSDGVPYPLFAFAGMLPWTYFAEATRRASGGLVDDAELVRKVYFPRLIMPLAKVAAPLLDFCIAFVVLVIMMLIYGVVPSAKMLLVFPLMLVATLLALAVSLWLGPINVRFRDIKHTLPLMITLWMYACPIAYPLSQVPEPFQMFYSLNPMVGVIEGFRWAAFDRAAPNWGALGVSFMAILVLLGGGLVFFRRMERSFADLI